MNVDYITLSIPVFFILIGIEFFYGLKKNIQLYRVNDSVTNISLGIGQQVTGVFMKTALFYGYLYLYENMRFSTIESNFLTWFALFIGVDFFYYWFHRLSHEVNALWAAHIVHHQSEDYNLSVALRQSWLQSAFSWAFYLPLALIGFEPVMFLTISSFNTLYQFWIHTRTIGKMGPLELIFNTPSHHRVHHGSDSRYLDKNHGGTLIIWDRLFGTFKEEDSEPHYGITTPLKSWNPVWANFHYWSELFKAARSARGLTNKIMVFMKPPGWYPDETGRLQPPVITDNREFSKYDAGVPVPVNYYVVTQFALVIALTSVILFLQAHFNVLQLVLSSAWVIASISIFGAQFEKASWANKAEYLRLLSLPILTLLFMNKPEFQTILTGLTFAAGISMIWFYRLTSQAAYLQTGKI